MLHAPEFNAAYGDMGPANALRYLEFTRSFLDQLSSVTMSKLIWRGYPPPDCPCTSVQPLMVEYDQKILFKQFLSKMKGFDDYKRSAKESLTRSKLVIINYLSTSYLEALLSNIPTVFLWNKDQRRSQWDGLPEQI